MRERTKEGTARRRDHCGDLGLASNQIPDTTKTTSVQALLLSPLHCRAHYSEAASL